MGFLDRCIDGFHSVIQELQLQEANTKVVLITCATGVAGIYVLTRLHESHKKSQFRRMSELAGKDVVVLHQLDRGRFTPSISPFPLKLETYMRITKIPYQNDFENPMGPKGKTPWMTLNEIDTADSQICLELLAKHFSKDLSSHLSEEQRATARAFHMLIEEHLYWVLLIWRWVYTKGETVNKIQVGLPWMIYLTMPLIRKSLRESAWGQGMGRHTKEEVYEMGLKDLRALSAYLGTKPYFTGEKVTELDCVAFGMLAQFLWNAPGSPYELLFNGELTNLKNFCLRMKENYWPDWDKCIKP